MSWRDGLMLIFALMIVTWVVVEIADALKRRRMKNRYITYRRDR